MDRFTEFGQPDTVYRSHKDLEQAMKAFPSRFNFVLEPVAEASTETTTSNETHIPDSSQSDLDE